MRKVHVLETELENGPEFRQKEQLSVTELFARKMVNHLLKREHRRKGRFKETIMSLFYVCCAPVISVQLSQESGNF